MTTLTIRISYKYIKKHHRTIQDTHSSLVVMTKNPVPNLPMNKEHRPLIASHDIHTTSILYTLLHWHTVTKHRDQHTSSRVYILCLTVKSLLTTSPNSKKLKGHNPYPIKRYSNPPISHSTSSCETPAEHSHQSFPESPRLSFRP